MSIEGIVLVDEKNYSFDVFYVHQLLEILYDKSNGSIVSVVVQEIPCI